MKSLSEAVLRIELARAGNWNGQVLTKEHLEQVVKNFKDEVPVVLGHLKADHMGCVNNFV